MYAYIIPAYTWYIHSDFNSVFFIIHFPLYSFSVRIQTAIMEMKFQQFLEKAKRYSPETNELQQRTQEWLLRENETIKSKSITYTVSQKFRHSIKFAFTLKVIRYN